ncbi:MAG: aldo/keto reductase [Aquificaceae bacterium]
MKKLLLGTANFGMDYGIAFGKRVPKEEVFRMLDLAKEKKIFGIDTAPAYGKAQEIIGEYLQKKVKPFRIITKLPKRSYKDTLEVKNTLLKSLENLKVDSIDYLLIHSFETFKEWKGTLLCIIQRRCWSF